MKKRWLLTGLGLMLIVVFGTAPARAQSVDDKIQNLEQELSQLKSQQIEMKKDAAAAAAALPSFTYRPANGLLMEAADKSWGLRFSLESHFRLLFENGRPQAGRSHGELMGRRFRPYINYCLNDCLYEMEMGLDLDGFGTGNGKNATGTEVNSILQRGVVYVHFERLNPWLPRLEFGMDLTGIGIIPYRKGPSLTAAQGEYDLLSRNTGFNTGRAGQGFLLSWNNLPFAGIGRWRFQFARGSIGEADDGRPSFKEPTNYNTGIQVEPFTQLKNKWLRGLGFSFNAFFCNEVTANNNISTVTKPDFGCSRNRVQDHGDGGRQVLFDSGTITGRGMNTFFMPGIGWRVGPYALHAVMGFTNYGANKDLSFGTTTGHIVNRGRDFLIGHELWVWSPKGFLTGAANTPGSVLFGTHFERGDWWCNRPEGHAPCASGAQFSRERVLLREWDLWYFLTPQSSVGVNLLWYDASNLRTGFGQAGDNLGVCNGRSRAPCQYKDWTTVWLNWRMNF